ncbi:MAG: cysteine hydrolase family protein [Actinomycetota bacterium]
MSAVTGGQPSDRELLAAVYPRASWPPLDVGRLALLVIDLQLLCAAPDRGMFAAAAALGRPDLLEPYRRRLADLVVPNAAALAAAARRRGVPVVFTKIESLTPTGAERSGCHRALGLHVPPGDADGEILPALAPDDDDLVVAKTASDAFVGTNLEYLLRNLDVAHLAVCGVLSHECVESTVRHAADLGFVCHVVEDACAAVEADRHAMAMRDLGQSYGEVTATAALLDALDAGRATGGRGAAGGEPAGGAAADGRPGRGDRP